MKIICNHCKSEIVNCPECDSTELERKNTSSVIFLTLVLIACLISAYRWNAALEDHERAQRLRRAYLKEKLGNRPTLPFSK